MLALYIDNDIVYTRNASANSCVINKGNARLKSRFFGFHKMPFHVEIIGALDQICTLFQQYRI